MWTEILIKHLYIWEFKGEQDALQDDLKLRWEENVTSFSEASDLQSQPLEAFGDLTVPMKVISARSQSLSIFLNLWIVLILPVLLSLTVQSLIWRRYCMWFRSVLPQPLAAGGGDVVMQAAGVYRRLDFRLAALWGMTKGLVFFKSHCDISMSFWHYRHCRTQRNSTVTTKHSLFWWENPLSCLGSTYCKTIASRLAQAKYIYHRWNTGPCCLGPN